MEMHMFMYVGGTELLADKILSHQVFFFTSVRKLKVNLFKKSFKTFPSHKTLTCD